MQITRSAWALKMAVVVCAAVLALSLSVAQATQVTQAAWADEASYQAATAGMSRTAVHVQSSGDHYLDAKGNEVEEGSADKAVAIKNLSAGSFDYDAATNTLTLNNASVDSVDFHQKSAKLNLVGKSTVKNGVGTWSSVDNLTVEGSGSIDSAFDTDGDLTVNGGTITSSKKDVAVSCVGNLIVAGGSIQAKNAKSLAAISVRNSSEKTASIKVTGGSIAVSGSAGVGIELEGGDFTMSGGRVSVTNCKNDAIKVEKSSLLSAKKGGGKVVITGGQLSAQTSKPDRYAAIDAVSMKNKSSFLKSIKGELPKGAEFKSGSNEFRVTGYIGDRLQTILIRYGAKSKVAKLGFFYFGKKRYDVQGAGPNAFNTKQGAKLKSITFSEATKVFGANALSGTKSLTKLVLISPYIVDSGSKLKWAKGSSVSKKAFSKCGKSGGKKLALQLSERGVPKARVAAYKKFFAKYGMYAKVKMPTFVQSSTSWS